MCIIIDRPAEHSLTMSILQECARYNRDGWGIMFHDSGEVITCRGLHFADFERTYSKLPPDLPMTIHFRFATHGRKDMTNTHPYQVLSKQEHGRDLWVMHNGIIHTDSWDRSMSDTWHWIQGILLPCLQDMPDLLERRSFRKLLEETVDGSRLIFLDDTGKKQTLNPYKWVQYLGCEWSNDDFVPMVYTPSQLKRRADIIGYTGGKYADTPFLQIGNTNSDGKSGTTSERFNAWDDWEAEHDRQHGEVVEVKREEPFTYNGPERNFGFYRRGAGVFGWSG